MWPTGKSKIYLIEELHYQVMGMNLTHVPFPLSRPSAGT